MRSNLGRLFDAYSQPVCLESALGAAVLSERKIRLAGLPIIAFQYGIIVTCPLALWLSWYPHGKGFCVTGDNKNPGNSNRSNLFHETSPMMVV
jgi:hypothetical protein